MSNLTSDLNQRFGRGIRHRCLYVLVKNVSFEGIAHRRT